MILSIQTSSGFSSITISKTDGATIDWINDNEMNMQSEKLNQLVCLLLKRNNIRIKEVEYISVCNGPGSFNGIRIGLGYVYGISLITNAKIIPISLFEAIIHTVEELDNCIIAIHSSKSRFFYIDYQINYGMFITQQIIQNEINVLTTDLENLQKNKKKIILICNAKDVCYLDKNLKKVVKIVPKADSLIYSKITSEMILKDEISNLKIEAIYGAEPLIGKKKSFFQ